MHSCTLLSFYSTLQLDFSDQKNRNCTEHRPAATPAAPHAQAPAPHGGRGRLRPARSRVASSPKGRRARARPGLPRRLPYHLRGDGAEDVQHGGGGARRLTVLVVVVVRALRRLPAVRVALRAGGGGSARRVPPLSEPPAAVKQDRKAAAELAGNAPRSLRPVRPQPEAEGHCLSCRHRTAPPSPLPLPRARASAPASPAPSSCGAAIGSGRRDAARDAVSPATAASILRTPT